MEERFAGRAPGPFRSGRGGPLFALSAGLPTVHRRPAGRRELLAKRGKTTISAVVYDVFAYGSLQVPGVMAAVARQHAEFGPAWLEGYLRQRLRSRPYPGIRRRSGARVEGVLYRRMGRLALAHLDRFEDGFYRRRTLRVVVTGAAPVLAEVYVIPPRHHRLLEPRSWCLQRFRRYRLKNYLRRCRRHGRSLPRASGGSGARKACRSARAGASWPELRGARITTAL